jgi:hypothetical protein
MIRSPPCATTHRHICSPGKSTFLKYMLVRLISAKQVVLLCDSFYTYLFHRGQVYGRLMASGLGNLPRYRKAYCPVWALIDMDFEERGPSIISSSNIWPIQASPPKPILWKSWSKQFGAALLGMPLWDMEELMEGYVFSFFSLSAINPGHVVW